jgi:hypothetical protein
MIPVTHQLKAAPKRVERALLKQEHVQRTREIYSRGAELLPAEYLIVHQEADEATTEKVKTKAEAKRTRIKERNIRLARNEEISSLLVAAGQHNLLRSPTTRLLAREFLDAGTQPEETPHKEPATA